MAEGYSPDRREYDRQLVESVQMLVRTVNAHETRLAVLETKSDATESRLEHIEQDVRATKDGVQKVLDRLTEHTSQEDKDRQRLLVAVIATLLSVIGGILMLGLPHFLTR